MDALKISAQFAAYTWYMGMKDEARTAKAEAMRFAREHSTAFTSCAHEGLGRLLLRLAVGSKGSRRRRKLAAEPSPQL
jgi:hypothetical protein